MEVRWPAGGEQELPSFAPLERRVDQVADAAAPLGGEVGDGPAVPPAVVALAQSGDEVDGGAGAAERGIDGLHGAAQVGGEDRVDPVDPVVAAMPASSSTVTATPFDRFRRHASSRRPVGLGEASDGRQSGVPFGGEAGRHGGRHGGRHSGAAGRDRHVALPLAGLLRRLGVGVALVASRHERHGGIAGEVAVVGDVQDASGQQLEVVQERASAVLGAKVGHRRRGLLDKLVEGILGGKDR